ncbi:hypothetical protein HMPREF1978_01109 [Actinomyces graevenitzii F0530]|uniref:Uncharacterized protein n=1 Tax=Actinomyces graevenitzii F0530 TaxID=1321817 RepID=U1PJ50_9ACTO|nr:hypothetical protein HMPREF1978_01109 [Actinomyces graevenitzii F0530]
MRLGGLWQGVSALGEGPVWAKWVETAGSADGVETDSADGVETGSAGGALKVSRRPNPTKP